MYTMKTIKLFLFGFSIFYLPLFLQALQPDFSLHLNDPEWLTMHLQKNQTLESDSSSTYEIHINNVTFCLIKKDITQLYVDGIVNAANQLLARGGGVCGVIFQAAEGNTQILQEYIRANHPHGIEPGQAIRTPSFNLEPEGIKHIIHAVGPIYHRYTDKNIAKTILQDSYSNSLLLAASLNLSSLAFPFISSGIYGFPKEEAAEIAINILLQHTKMQTTSVKKIYFTLIHQEDFELFKKFFEQFGSKENSNEIA